MMKGKKLTDNKTTINSNNTNKNYYILSCIIILTIIIYSISLLNGFLVGWDDENYVTLNPDIMDLSFHGLENLCTRFYVSCYLPLTMLTYALEYKFFGMNPIAYHIDNLILHLLNTILVYIFVKSLFRSPQSTVHGQQSTDHRPQSTVNSQISQLSILICPLLFAIHPMHVESVAWISERKDLLYTFFYLASLIYYCKYIKSSNLQIFKSSNYLLSLITFFLSLLSKSMAVTLPVVLILIDYFKGRLKFSSKFIHNAKLFLKVLMLSLRSGKVQSLKFIIEKLPFFILSLAFGIITIYSQKTSSFINEKVLHTNFIDKFFMLNYAVSFYIVKLFAPINLSAIHPCPDKVSGLFPIEYYLSPLLILSILFLVYIIIKAKNKKITPGHSLQTSASKVIILGILFFLVTISVVLSIPYGFALVAERYTYVPYLGFFIIIGYFYNSLKFKVQSLKFKIFHTSYFLLLISYCVLFSVLTFSRNKVWRDGITLFSDVIEKHPGESTAYNNRGHLKSYLHDYTGAMVDFNKAILINSNYGVAYNSRGFVKLNLNDYKGALEDFNKAISLKPRYGSAYINRGYLKGYMGNFEDAKKDLDKSIAFEPDCSLAYCNRGWIKGNLYDYTGAMEDLNKAIELDPNSDMAFTNIGWIKFNMKHYKEAIIDLDKALKINPENAQAHLNRGSAEFYLKDITAACEDWNISLKLGNTEAKIYIDQVCSKYK